MADTQTPNILLVIADLNDTFNFGAHVEANFTTIDSLMGAVDCTSTSRPTNTYKGQIAYEHDSGRYVQNTGTKGAPVWTYTSHAALAVTAASHPTSGLANGGLALETDTDMLMYYNTAWRYQHNYSVASSSRPTSGLTTGMPLYETDTTRFLIWNGSSWVNKAYANFVTTSSAHPANPFQGLEIYETDTGLSAVYNGSTFSYGVQQVAATQVLVGTTASVTFSGIPAVTRLSLSWRAKTATAVQTDLLMQVDGDTAAHYLWAKIEAANGASSPAHTASLTTSMKIGVVSGTTASFFGNGRQEIDGWSNSTGFLTTAGPYANFDAAGTDWAGTAAGQFSAVGPHTSIKLLPATGSFAAGSQFSLYGLE